MKLTQILTTKLESCYAVSFLNQDNKSKALAATDGAGECIVIDVSTGEKETVWRAPGGTMSLVPIPDTNGDFLAVQNFLPGFNAAGAEIVYAHRGESGWEVKPWVSIPYIHRVDILTRHGKSYVVFCKLCCEKSFEDDWSSAGEILVTDLPKDFSCTPKLTRIAQGMHRNHGFHNTHDAEGQYCLIACDEGVFKVTPPDEKGEWEVLKIIDESVSDIAVADIDGDGEMEMLVLKPFHGDEVHVYKDKGNGYSSVFELSKKMPFSHAIWSGNLLGKPCFLTGCRRGDMELFVIYWENGEIKEQLLTVGGGPANVAVLKENGKDIILVANHTKGEATLFLCAEEG